MAKFFNETFFHMNDNHLFERKISNKIRNIQVSSYKKNRMPSFVAFHLTEVNIVTIKIFPTNRWVDKCFRRRQNYSSVEMRMKMIMIIIIVINKNQEKNGKWRKCMSTLIGVFHVKRDTLGSIIKLRRNQNEMKTKRKKATKKPWRNVPKPNSMKSNTNDIGLSHRSIV